MPQYDRILRDTDYCILQSLCTVRFMCLCDWFNIYLLMYWSFTIDII